MAGASRPSAAATAPTISSAAPGPPGAGLLNCPMSPCIRRPTSTLRGRTCGRQQVHADLSEGAVPPVNPLAFWSLTMYENTPTGLWFYPNPLNKLTLSPRNKLKYNKNGSLTLYFQHASPGKDKEANWLPAPEGLFALTLRMYRPNTAPPSILDGTWQPPGLLKVQ